MRPKVGKRLWDAFIESDVIGIFISLASGMGGFVVANWDLIPFISTLSNGKTIVGLSFFAAAATVRSIALAHRLKPRMICTFDMDEPGCVRRNVIATGAPGPNKDYYRIKVKGKGFIESFGGRVTFIRGHKSGEILDGEYLDLTPAFRENGVTTDIRNGNTEYLDFLFITETGLIRFATPGFKYPASCDAALERIEKTPDTYEIGVTISAETSAPIDKKLLFEWPGRWRAATMMDITDRN